MPRAPSLRVEPLEGRLTPNARLQVVNDSPFAAARLVDVYVNNVKVADDLAFRGATAFFDVPAGAPLTINVDPGTAPDNSQPASTLTISVADGKRAAVIAVGDPNAPSGATRFGLAVTDAAQDVSDNPPNATFLAFHGAPDGPALDFKLRDVATLVENLPYGRFAADYLAAPAGKYTLDVTAADGTSPVGSFVFDLSGAAGKAALLLASGFVAPPTGSDPSFGLLAVFADGSTQLLPLTAAFGGGSFAAGGAGTATQFSPTGSPGVSGDAFSSNVPARAASADVNGDKTDDLIVGAGPGGAPVVRIFDGLTRKEIKTLDAFEPSFTGGVFVTAADVNNDGFADIIVTPDQGGGPRVRIFSGKDFSLLADFFGIDDPNFRGGARAAAGDINGDGALDLLVAAGFGGGPRVAGFDGTTLGSPAPKKLFADFFVFEQTLRNGVFVTAGDLDGDGFADVIVGGGPGGGPRVFAVSGKQLVQSNQQATLANFFAGPPANRDGVRLAAKNLDGDYKIDLVTGLGSPGVPQVQTFLGKSILAGGTTASLQLNPFTTLPAGGVVSVG